jgi:hypothetical protein
VLIVLVALPYALKDSPLRARYPLLVNELMLMNTVFVVTFVLSWISLIPAKVRTVDGELAVK